jgi:anti-sigma factor RsiW
MNCGDVQRLLDPYADGELDLVRHVEIDEHLAECAACAEQEKRLRSLRAAVSSPELYHRAPDALRARVLAAAPPTPRSPRGRRLSWRPFALAAGILILAGASAVIGAYWPRGPSADDRLAEWVVAGHVRSLQVKHLTDVASTDRHTVKPWFRGKLDFSPVVPDLSARRYDLTGGRLDYLADRPVAALVYERRLHAINVFTWPAADGEGNAVRGLARQGFHLRSWQQSGMTYWAVSDLNDEELDDFVRLFREHAAEPRP